MFYFYILKSQLNNSYYFGSCADTDIRLKQHNAGLVKSTKRYIPWELAHIEQFNDFKNVRNRESQVKSWKKRSAIENLIKHSKNLM
ncbi:MAG: GIY-YIG nuclease family protein [Patescibacteria group bacterium]